MVTPGTDSHKAPHTFVATDDTGRELGQATFSADPDGHLKALRWSSKWPERCWALEDCRHLSRIARARSTRRRGDTKTEAIRALRRRISDEVYRRLWPDEHLAAACLRQAA